MEDGPSGYPCDPWDAHVFEETYYGHTCKKCGLFYAHGCAPWDDDDAPDPTEVEGVDYLNDWTD